MHLEVLHFSSKWEVYYCSEDVEVNSCSRSEVIIEVMLVIIVGAGSNVVAPVPEEQAADSQPASASEASSSPMDVDSPTAGFERSQCHIHLQHITDLILHVAV